MDYDPLSALFADKLESDDREPVFTFSAPVIGGTYGVLGMNVYFWLQLLSIIAIQGACVAGISLLMYEFIVRRRGSSWSYLFGFGVVIPFCVISPYYAISLFDIRNKILKFIIATIFPTLTVFKCIEAMYGFSPSGVEVSVQNYTLYFFSSMEVLFDPKTGKPVKVTTDQKIRELLLFVLHVLLLGTYKSLLLPFNYEPFPTKDVSGIRSVFDLGHIGNNFVSAIVFQLYLTTFCHGLVAATNIVLGVKTKVVMNNPIFQSTSPSDFWGRKWNSVVHGVLKRGVFKPVRLYFSKHVAAGAAFLASGLFHELILLGVYHVHEHEKDADGTCGPPNCYSPRHGVTMAFFLWNGIVVVLEYALGDLWLFSWVKRSVPQPFLSFLVISMALPVAHWFTDSYIKTDFFDDGQVGFPMIVRVS